MIKPFRHKGLEAFFLTGSRAGIQPSHAAKLRVILTALDNAKQPSDMDSPYWRLHTLTGDLAGRYSLTVNKNWRITFLFNGEDVELVDYLNYH